MTIILPLIIIAGFAAGLVLWPYYGLPAAAGLTSALMDFCQSLLVKCVEYSYLAKAASVWLGISLLGGGFLYALIKGSSGAIRSYIAVRRLPLKDRGLSLVLIDDPSVMAAFTHGLLKPRIYISKGMLQRLERDERKAVFLHELCHRRRKDPLRFFLLTFLKDMFFPVPLVKDLVTHIRIRKEEEADTSAAYLMNEPLSLSGALLKVARENTSILYGAALLDGYGRGGGRGGRGGRGGVEDRVRGLIEGKKSVFKFPSLRAAAISLTASLVILTSLTLPLSSGIRLLKECSLTHCELHADRLGKDCKTHCKTPSHRHSSHGRS